MVGKIYVLRDGKKHLIYISTNLIYTKNDTHKVLKRILV